LVSTSRKLLTPPQRSRLVEEAASVGGLFIFG
jgi:hypothetical protein